MANTVSPQGASFTAELEGFVTHFYRDSGGVGTIGNGFTAMSKVFSEYWMQTRGHKLRAGDTITRDESTMLLQKVMDAEYAPPVAKKYGNTLTQNQFDAATDTVYNCGAGTLKDAWATFLAENQVAAAASRLLTTRITAGGRKLAGLYHRRLAEAHLLLNGDYGSAAATNANAAADTASSVAADLTKLGYKDVTSFQAANGLVVDGIAGPATRATIRRALDAKTAKTAAKTVGTGSTAATAATHHVATAHAATSFDIHTLYWAAGLGLAAVAAVGIGYLIYRNRGVILRKRTPA
jgi:lysozyme